MNKNINLNLVTNVGKRGDFFVAVFMCVYNSVFKTNC